MDADKPEEAASTLYYLKSHPKSVIMCNLWIFQKVQGRSYIFRSRKHILPEQNRELSQQATECLKGNLAVGGMVT